MYLLILKFSSYHHIILVQSIMMIYVEIHLWPKVGEYLIVLSWHISFWNMKDVTLHWNEYG